MGGENRFCSVFFFKRTGKNQWREENENEDRMDRGEQEEGRLEGGEEGDWVVQKAGKVSGRGLGKDYQSLVSSESLEHLG